MCRWAAYLGTQIPIEDLVAAPAHSLIKQSLCATRAKTATNGDGFGLAWYGTRAEPGLYRDILPAWSDANLKSLVHQIASPLFLAHVRASTGGATSRDNCHPFVHGRWSFMHNGQIGSFDALKRRLEARLSDALYRARHGTTDSELLFLLALEMGLATDPIGAVARAVGTVIEEAEEAGVQPHIRLTAAFSDGVRLYAVRYATDAHAPSLFAAPAAGGKGFSLVSEPLDDEPASWREVAAGSALVADGSGVSERPFAPVYAANAPARLHAVM